MNDKPEPRPCSYCGHLYIKLCDGREDCPNRVWFDEAQRRSSDAKRKESTKEAMNG